VTSEDTAYNGTLTFKFTLTTSTKYCVTLASDSYAYSEAKDMKVSDIEVIKYKTKNIIIRFINLKM